MENKKIANLKIILQEVGFTKEEIDNFMKYQQDKNWLDQEKCIEEKRKRLLEEVHKQEHQIACLDCFKYKLEKERNL